MNGFGTKTKFFEVINYILLKKEYTINVIDN